MSSFSQWFKAYQDGRGVRQITYICGTEPVLVDDVRLRVWRTVGSTWNFLAGRADGTNDRVLWEWMERRPTGSGTAVTLIEDAEKLKDTSRLHEWVKNRKQNPNHFLILVSQEDSAPRVPVGEPRENKTELAPHLHFGAAGWVVECKPFTAATVKHAVQWVQTLCPMSPAVAGHLLNRADANLRLVRDTAEKLRIFPGTITQSVVNDLLSEQPRDSFVDALLAMDKKTALAALARMPKEDFSRTIGALDSTLELAGLVHDYQLNNKPRYELLKAAGKRAFLVPDIEKVSKHYDAKRRVRNRQLLLLADEVIGAGETEGVLEAITALW